MYLIINKVYYLWEEILLDNSTLDIENYKNLVNLTPQILCILSLAGKIKYSNPAFNKIFGYSNYEVQGLNLFSIVHLDDKKGLESALLSAHKKQLDAINLEFRYMYKDGNFKLISWNIKFQ